MSARRNGLANAPYNREDWLNEAVCLLRTHTFAPLGYAVPPNVRVSCSWPSRGGTGTRRRTIREAWHSTRSNGGYFEIFISPTLSNELEVLATVAHELVHVTVGFKCGHRGAFKTCALAIGLEGPMTTTHAAEAFKRLATVISDALGAYPHAALDAQSSRRIPTDDNDLTTGTRPQKGRLHKAHCPICGLTMRLTKSWIIGRDLGCPDINCAGHTLPLVIS